MYVLYAKNFIELIVNLPCSKCIMALKTQPNDICFEREKADIPFGTSQNSLQIVLVGWLSFENFILLIELESHYAN